VARLQQCGLINARPLAITVQDGYRGLSECAGPAYVPDLLRHAE